MVSFYLQSLFTSFALEHIIDIVVKPIYEKHEVATVFTKN